MDRKGHREIKRYILIFAAFAVIFTGFCWAAAVLNETGERSLTAELIAVSPENEAAVVNAWQKSGKESSLFSKPSEEESSAREDALDILEKKYGYSFRRGVSQDRIWKVWALSLGILALCMVLTLALQNRKKNAEREKEEKLMLGVYECLEKFRRGDFEQLPPDTFAVGEEAERVRETLNSLGAYFRNLKDKAEEEQQSTKMLITDISHQLKTPLASLKMSHELVMTSYLNDEERNSFLKSETEDIEKLENLMNELVSLSRLEAGMIKINPEMSDLRETVAAAVSRIMQKARSRKTEIRVEMEDSVIIRHDSRWTEEALLNVMDNGIKYSYEGGLIDVKVSEMATNVLVEISDRGIGIPEDEINRIFMRFYRGKRASEMSGEGAGVGLYLARRIIEAQGGTVSAVRGRECGTTFRIILPKE
ncbi:MAG: HAMP domain-containing sensor histidine kinase [Bacillota bacterium]|nr:HAMP domain-containing sensor histidine kinase [Bacillota bacterium]